MDKVRFSETEELLYAGCGSTERIDRYRQSVTMRGIALALLFAVLAFTGMVSVMIGIVLALYSLYTLFELCRFAAVCDGYRAVQNKLAVRLFERTGDAGYESCAQEAAGDRSERMLRRNSALLSSFYVVFLGVCFFVMPEPFSGAAASAGTAVVFLLELKLKLTAANTMKYYRTTIYKLGRTLEEMSRGDAPGQ